MAALASSDLTATLGTPPRDYSQSGEQAAILAWAADREPGMFLDLGAGNGETFSNTRALWLSGWGGCCVEPSPSEFAALCELYPQVMQERVVERVNAAVVADRGGLRDFYYVPGDHLSSLDPDSATRWEVVPERIVVAAIPLEDLLDEWLLAKPQYRNGFQFVSIDTEGSSLELLRAYGEHRAWPAVECVCVEAEDGAERREIERVLRHWRLLAVTPNNMVLAR